MSQQQHVTTYPMRADAACTECATIIATGSVGEAIAFLNGRTRFRFTGVYQVDPPHLRNLLLYDRENPHLNLSGAVTPLDDTYCALTYALGPFETSDSQRDSRLTKHASRDSVISYTGVPLRLTDGRVWGTLCHYDVRPRLLSPDEQSLLQSVAPMVVAALHPQGTAPRAVSASPSTVLPGSAAPRT